MILSNRITANRRDANPEIHANINTAKVIKLLQPAAFRLIIIFLEVFIVPKSNIQTGEIKGFLELAGNALS